MGRCRLRVSSARSQAPLRLLYVSLGSSDGNASFKGTPRSKLSTNTRMRVEREDHALLSNKLRRKRRKASASFIISHDDAILSASL